MLVNFTNYKQTESSVIFLGRKADKKNILQKSLFYLQLDESIFDTVLDIWI